MSETTEKPIQLEDGKFYLTRSGEVVGPVERREAFDTHPWRAGGSYYVYLDNGRLYSDRIGIGESPNDLVSEFAPASLTEAR